MEGISYDALDYFEWYWATCNADSIGKANALVFFLKGLEWASYKNIAVGNDPEFQSWMKNRKK